MTIAEIIQEARQLHAAGDFEAAKDLLDAELYNNGWRPGLHTEMNRLFPITPEVQQKLKEYDSRLNDTNAKSRQKAAKEISRLALGERWGEAREFLRYPETTALLTRQLANPDLVVQENMTIALAMAFWRYTRDDRAFEPLVAQLKSKTINTRAWAIEALAHLSDRGVEQILPLIYDKAERVRNEAFRSLIFAVDGGGTLSRPPMGPEGLLKIREAMLQIDRNREVDFRVSSAQLLAMSASPEDLAELRSWQKKDGSKAVKEALQRGIDRLLNPPPAPSPPVIQAPARKSATPKKAKKTTKKPAPAKPPADPTFAPCQFAENADGGPHSLIFTDFHLADEIFEGLDRDGGGYGWHGVVDALVRLKDPKLVKHLAYDPEASMFVALSKDRDALKQVADLIRSAIDNPKLLKQAIKKANPKLMD